MNTLESSLSSRRSRVAALGIFAALSLMTAAVAPFAATKLPESPTLFTIFLTLAWAGDVLTAFLFLIQGRIGRSTPLLVLSSGYAFSSLVIVLHALTFPGVFAKAGLLGADAQSAIWFWVAWHGGFPLSILAYVAAQRRHERGAASRGGSRRTVASLAAFVGAAVVSIGTIVLRADRFLPALIEKGHFGLLISTGVGPLVIAAIVAAIAALAYSTRLRRVTDVWLAVALLASLADCSITLAGSARYTLGWDVARGESLFASTVVLLTFLRGIDAVLRRLSAISRLDGLTGLANRRSFDEEFDTAVALAARADKPLSIVLFDVDDFKKFNDAYGHPSGDETLRVVADCIAKSLVRKTDFAARWGGEEFVVLLPATDLAGASKIAERVRATVQRCGLEHRGSAHGVVTVSCGVATTTGAELRERNAGARAVAAADSALYRAKAAGRNWVELQPMLASEIASSAANAVAETEFLAAPA